MTSGPRRLPDAKLQHELSCAPSLTSHELQEVSVYKLQRQFRSIPRIFVAQTTFLLLPAQHTYHLSNVPGSPFYHQVTRASHHGLSESFLGRPRADTTVESSCLARTAVKSFPDPSCPSVTSSASWHCPSWSYKQKNKSFEPTCKALRKSRNRVYRAWDNTGRRQGGLDLGRIPALPCS